MKLSLGCLSEFPDPLRSDIFRDLRHWRMRKFAGHSYSGLYTALPAVEFEPLTAGFGVQRRSFCSIPTRVILEHAVSNSRARLYLSSALVLPYPDKYVGNLVGHLHSWATYGLT